MSSSQTVTVQPTLTSSSSGTAIAETVRAKSSAGGRNLQEAKKMIFGKIEELEKLIQTGHTRHDSA